MCAPCPTAFPTHIFSISTLTEKLIVVHLHILGTIARLPAQSQ
jgi:hypothetical protein